MLQTDLSFADDVEVVDENVGCGHASTGRVDQWERPASARDRVNKCEEDSSSCDALNCCPVDANVSALEHSVVTAV